MSFFTSLAKFEPTRQTLHLYSQAIGVGPEAAPGRVGDRQPSAAGRWCLGSAPGPQPAPAGGNKQQR